LSPLLEGGGKKNWKSGKGKEGGNERMAWVKKEREEKSILIYLLPAKKKEYSKGEEHRARKKKPRKGEGGMVAAPFD